MTISAILFEDIGVKLGKQGIIPEISQAETIRKYE